MSVSFLVREKALEEINKRLYLSGILSKRTSLTAAMCGQDKNYSSGKLENAIVKTSSFDLVQDITDGAFAELLTPTTTELKTLNAIESQEQYVKRALTAKIVISVLDKSIESDSVNTQILMRMFKQFDALTYAGFYGNTGVLNSKNHVSIVSAATALSVSAIAQDISRVKRSMSFADAAPADADLTISVGSKIAEFLDGTDANNNSKTLWTALKESFAGAMFKIIPDYIVGRTKSIDISYRPANTFQHGAIPSLYSTEPTEHGLGSSTLFAMETAKIQIGEKGAITSIEYNI